MTDSEGQPADKRVVSVRVSGLPDGIAAFDKIKGAAFNQMSGIDKLIGPVSADAAKALESIHGRLGAAVVAQGEALLPLKAQLEAVAATMDQDRLVREPLPQFSMPSIRIPVDRTASNTAELVRISSESLRVASEQQVMMVALVAEVQAGAKRELDAAKHEAHRFKQTVAIGTVLAFLSAGAGAVLTRLFGG